MANRPVTATVEQHDAPSRAHFPPGPAVCTWLHYDRHTDSLAVRFGEDRLALETVDLPGATIHLDDVTGEVVLVDLYDVRDRFLVEHPDLLPTWERLERKATRPTSPLQPDLASLGAWIASILRGHLSTRRVAA